MKYIPAEKLIAEIERMREINRKAFEVEHIESGVFHGRAQAINHLFEIITSLQQEQPEVDLEKLGGIARHLITVKVHEEDMRLDESEWLILERIGYPERFNARKEDTK